MDFKQWIYSPDIARWLSEERNLGLMELTDCILSAPHRTLGEKLEGLRELYREAKGERRQETGDQCFRPPGKRCRVPWIRGLWNCWIIRDWPGRKGKWKTC